MFETIFKKYKRIIFFDTETTGFDAENEDQMIELAAVAVDDNETVTSMDSFIRLFRKTELSQKIMDLTHITDLILTTEGVDEVEALEQFVKMMQPEEHDKEKSILLVAHNAQFDLQFLAYAIYRHRDYGKGWMYLLNNADYLDTLTVYKDRRSYPHKLENAITEYGLAGKVENSHRAIDDCKALMEVARKMDQEKDDLDKYINLFGYNPKYGPDKNQLKKVTYAPQSLNRFGNRTLYEEIKR